jgi:hypothetical protein
VNQRILHHPGLLVFLDYLVILDDLHDQSFLGLLGNPEYLVDLVDLVRPVVPANLEHQIILGFLDNHDEVLGILGILEDPGLLWLLRIPCSLFFPGCLARLGVLEVRLVILCSLEHLGHLVGLVGLDRLVGLDYLGNPGFLGILDNLVGLEVQEHLGCLDNLDNLAGLELLELLELLLILGVLGVLEILEAQSLPCYLPVMNMLPHLLDFHWSLKALPLLEQSFRW